MNKERNWLVTRIRQKFQNDEDFHAAIDLLAWDQMTPKERHEYVEKNIQDGFYFQSRYDLPPTAVPTELRKSGVARLIDLRVV